jgi:hypothetical protein
VDLVVRRPYPSVDAWLLEEAHLFSAQRAWLVGIDAPEGATAHVTFGLKGEDPLFEATVIVEGVAGDFKGQPLLSVRWTDLDAGAIETLQSLFRIDFSEFPPPVDAATGALALESAPVIDIDGVVDSVQSVEHPLNEAAPAAEREVESAPAGFGTDTLDRLRARAIAPDARRAILSRGRQLRGRAET